MQNSARKANRSDVRIHAQTAARDRAWFYVHPGETVVDAIQRVRQEGWQGPIGLSLALVA